MSDMAIFRQPSVRSLHRAFASLEVLKQPVCTIRVNSKAVAAHSELCDLSAKVLAPIIFKFVAMKNVGQRVVANAFLNDPLCILTAKRHFSVAKDHNPLEKIIARI